MVGFSGDAPDSEVVAYNGILTTLNEEIISNRADQHSHPANDSELSACKTIETIKTIIRESIDAVPSIYQRSMIEI